MTLSAFTPASGYIYYPPFFNARIENGEVVLTVRAPEKDNRDCGDMASMRVPMGEWRRILSELVAETERQSPTPEGREERS